MGPNWVTQVFARYCSAAVAAVNDCFRVQVYNFKISDSNFSLAKKGLEEGKSNKHTNTMGSMKKGVCVFGEEKNRVNYALQLDVILVNGWGNS